MAGRVIDHLQNVLRTEDVRLREESPGKGKGGGKKCPNEMQSFYFMFRAARLSSPHAYDANFVMKYNYLTFLIIVKNFWK